ncbi:MAG: glycosyltransferase family 4 protein, partial [Mesorhizobium sp.]
IAEDEKADFLGKAAGLLFPIDWPEPFGLAPIEAMACGTPSIAWNRGALPEIIDQGVTGFVVESMDEAIEAVPALLRLD